MVVRRCPKADCDNVQPCQEHKSGWTNWKPAVPLPPEWPGLRRYVLSKAKGRCALCRRPWWNLEVDHIIPRSAGGSNALTNLWALCKACHKEKTKRDKQKYKRR